MSKKLSILVFTISLFLGLGVRAQVTAHVTLSDNSEVSVLMDASGEIYFNGDRVVILESALTGNTQSWEMDQVRKVTFDGEFQSIDNPLSQGAVSLYPNPAHHSFSVSGIGSEPTMLSVYAVTGAKMLEQRCVDGDVINVSQLPSGIYFVRIGQLSVKMAIN